MNYYPNSNYYMGSNVGYQPQQMPVQSIQQMQQVQMLNGKVVDSPEMVRAAEVPIGSYGVFPKADLSEIYIKSWNNNGTTSVITYKPSPDPVQPAAANLENILQRLGVIEEKIKEFESVQEVKPNVANF